MTDHWKDVRGGWLSDYCGFGSPDAIVYEADYVDAARAKDAEAHAAALAAKDAEIAVLKGIHADVYAAAFADGKREADAEIVRLRAQIDEDAHLRSVVELYRSDPIAMADALVRMREALGAAREQLEQRPA